MLTRTGRNFYEVTSVMQNSIRKGCYEIAGHCLWELLPGYTPYLRKRFLVISAEDCFGIITKEIEALCSIGTEEALTKALVLMCLSKKNRDADYFVCNLMYSTDKTDLKKEELAKELHTAIRKMEIVKAGDLAAKLFNKNRNHFWDMLGDTARVYYPHLIDEVAALRKANNLVSKPAEEPIFLAKAMVLMWTKRDPLKGILGVEGMEFDELLNSDDIPVPKPVSECEKVSGLFPEWAYNWHTAYGKYKLRRDAVHAISNDQKLLTPLEVNLFDDCTWNRDINICLQRHNPNRYQLPFDDGKRKPEEKYGA